MLENKVVLVTGSSQGIGRAIALKCASVKAKVALNDIPPQKESLESLTQKIRSDGGKAWYFLADVSKPEEVKTMVQQVIERFEKIDVLVNNAGVCRDKTLAKMSLQEWQDVLEIDLTGVFNCTKAALPSVVQNKGKIISISSIVGQRGNFGQVNYAAAKAGIIGFTKALAKEVGKFGVTVNAIAPGFIETPLTKNLPDKVRNQIKALTSLRRFGKPEEIAELIVFLASNKADFITGAVINIDGGLSI